MGLLSEKLVSNVPKGKNIVLADGSTAKNLSELVDKLKEKDGLSLDDKSEIVGWIQFIIGDQELGKEVGDAVSREQVIEIIETRLYFAKISAELESKKDKSKSSKPPFDLVEEKELKDMIEENKEEVEEFKEEVTKKSKKLAETEKAIKHDEKKLKQFVRDEIEKISRLETEDFGDVKQQLEFLQSTLKLIQDENKSLKKQLDEKIAESSPAETGRLAARIEQLESENKAIKKDNSELKNFLRDELGKEKALDNSVLEKVSSRVQKVEEQNTVLQKENKELEDNLEKKFETVKNLFNADSISKTRYNIKELERLNKNLQKDNTFFKNYVDRALRKINDREVAEITHIRNKLKEFEHLNSRLKKMELKNKVLFDENSSLKVFIKDQIETKASELLKDAKIADKRLFKVEEDNNSFRKDIERRMKEIEKVDTYKIVKAEKTIESLVKKSDKISDEMTSFKSYVDGMLGKLSAVDIKNLRSLIDKVGEIKELKLKLKSIEKEVLKDENASEKLNDKIANIKVDVASLERESKIANNRMDKIVTHIEDVKDTRIIDIESQLKLLEHKDHDIESTLVGVKELMRNEIEHIDNDVVNKLQKVDAKVQKMYENDDRLQNEMVQLRKLLGGKEVDLNSLVDSNLMKKISLIEQSLRSLNEESSSVKNHTFGTSKQLAAKITEISKRLRDVERITNESKSIKERNEQLKSQLLEEDDVLEDLHLELAREMENLGKQASKSSKSSKPSGSRPSPASAIMKIVKAANKALNSGNASKASALYTEAKELFKVDKNLLPNPKEIHVLLLKLHKDITSS
jgi:DNA repair exonuclease SbcCD ATPase subunit